MADKTGIEWTEATWNPVTGCSKVSPGCAHCYAEAVTARYAGRPGWIEEHRPWTPENAAHNVRLRPERLDQPLRWKRPRMVFVNSMSDLFHEEVPDEYIEQVWQVMAQCPQHTFQILTKRPERMAELVPLLFDCDCTDETGFCRFCRSGFTLPLPNVWLGVSIENRRYVSRADLLRETPAAVRFISAEPLLGPLLPDADHYIDEEYIEYPLDDFPLHAWRPWADGYTGPGLNLESIDWLIVGGESGPDHRAMNPDWVRDLRDYCEEWPWQEGDGETKFFFKQWGGARSTSGGRELDGRTWDEMPERVTG